MMRALAFALLLHSTNALSTATLPPPKLATASTPTLALPFAEPQGTQAAQQREGTPRTPALGAGVTATDVFHRVERDMLINLVKPLELHLQ